MITVNNNFNALQKNYLFSEITHRISLFEEKNPNISLIKLGIGDTILPLAPSVIAAWKGGVEEMATVSGYRGYGPEQGYDFLRSAIATHDYKSAHINIDADEIFVSDGAKCDSANIQELFDTEITVAIPNPVYPVYYDTNIIAGRKKSIVYLNAVKENSFVCVPDDNRYDLIYLCYPNNPTGVVASRTQLAQWVEYAHTHQAIIIFDAAYERFITEKDIPHSIYEIDGAREVAIEMRSFSKTAGFTGVRCAYTVVPHACRAFTKNHTTINLHPIWKRRCSTKFNGVSYPVQRAAAAIYTTEGAQQIAQTVAYYMKNATIITDVLNESGVVYYGGKNAPYIWMETPPHTSTWDYFDTLLHDAHIVTTPGAGFGSNGEGYIRISAFNTVENIQEACRRFKQLLSKN